MPLARVSGQFFFALVGHAVGRRGRLCFGGACGGVVGFVFGIGLMCAPPTHAASQAAWTKLPDLGTHASPALSGLSDGRLYVVAVALDGRIAYTSTDAPGGWTGWQILGAQLLGSPDQAFRADPYTSPVLVRDGGTLYLFVRGRDNNLYATYRVGTSEWTWGSPGSVWQQLTFDSRVRSRVSVALTKLSEGGAPEFHVVYGGVFGQCGQASPVSCPVTEYRRFDAQGAETVAMERWEYGTEGTIGTDGRSRLLVAIRTSGNGVRFGLKSREEVLQGGRGGGPPGGVRVRGPWPAGWQEVTPGTVGAGNRKFLDLSNVAYFAGYFHVAVGTQDSLVHIRIRPRWPDHGREQLISSSSLSAPSPGAHGQAELVVYRNKLVMAYRDGEGQVRYARWDNADPAVPWIGRDVVDPSQRTTRRPALGVLNRRNFLGIDGYAVSNFGHDLLSAVTGNGTPSLWFVNLSRAMLLRDIVEQLAVYDSKSDGLDPPCRFQSQPFAPTRVFNLPDDNRPILSELGHLFWTLPSWLSRHTFGTAARLGCQMGPHPSGRFDPPCSAVRYPIVITKGMTFLCSGIWVARWGEYTLIWEELGHTLSGIMGLWDWVHPKPSIANQSLTGIPLAALTQAYNLFGQRVRGDQSCVAGAAPGGRCRGFSGIPGNYDVRDGQHSFIYVMYYYFSDGDYLRERVR